MKYLLNMIRRQQLIRLKKIYKKSLIKNLYL
jgi:hypothetical protein